MGYVSVWPFSASAAEVKQTMTATGHNPQSLTLPFGHLLGHYLVKGFAVPYRAVLIIPPRSELQRLVQVSVLSVGILNLESGLRSFKRRNVAPVLSEREDARLSVGGVKKQTNGGFAWHLSYRHPISFYLRDILLSSDNIHSEARPCACLPPPPPPSKKKSANWRCF